jgi:hypothetical protein
VTGADQLEQLRVAVGRFEVGVNGEQRSIRYMESDRVRDLGDDDFRNERGHAMAGSRELDEEWAVDCFDLDGP